MKPACHIRYHPCQAASSTALSAESQFCCMSTVNGVLQSCCSNLLDVLALDWLCEPSKCGHATCEQEPYKSQQWERGTHAHVLLLFSSSNGISPRTPAPTNLPESMATTAVLCAMLLCGGCHHPRATIPGGLLKLRGGGLLKLRGGRDSSAADAGDLVCVLCVVCFPDSHDRTSVGILRRQAGYVNRGKGKGRGGVRQGGQGD